MTESPKTPRPASSGPARETAASEQADPRTPRPPRGAGRPVDGAARPEGRAGGRRSDAGRRPEWDRLRRSGFGAEGDSRASQGVPGGERGDGEPGDGERRDWGRGDWERLRQAGLGGQGGASPPGGPPNLASLLVLVEALRGVVPNELERQFSALVREFLLTLRALIDWYLERLDGDGDERRVEDIPID